MSPVLLLQLIVIISIVFVVLAIRNHPKSIIYKYWAVLLSITGIVLAIFGSIGLYQTNKSYDQFVLENNFEPDGYGGLIFLGIIFVGALTSIGTSFSAYKQIKHHRKHI